MFATRRIQRAFRRENRRCRADHDCGLRQLHLERDPTVKQFGVGLSVGVALAAMTVLVFAPAVLVLAGRGAWRLPGWLDRSCRTWTSRGPVSEEVPEAPAPGSIGP